jgi:hypothetical protein
MTALGKRFLRFLRVAILILTGGSLITLWRIYLYPFAIRRTWGLIGASIFILFLLYLIARIKSYHELTVSKLSKHLEPTFTTDIDRIEVVIGGTTVRWPLDAFERPQGYPLAETWDVPLRIYVTDSRPSIDANIHRGSGLEFVEIEKNQLAHLPTGWDRNSNERAVEIVDERQRPIFQMIYEPPNRVIVNGVFVSDSSVVPIQVNQAIIPIQPEAITYPSRIFKYPSSHNLGEVDLS